MRLSEDQKRENEGLKLFTYIFSFIFGLYLAGHVLKWVLS